MKYHCTNFNADGFCSDAYGYGLITHGIFYLMYTALCAVLAETMYEYFVESSEEEEEKIYLKFTQPD